MAESSKNIIDSTYLVPYAENYHNLPWYERDFIRYIDHLKYQRMLEGPTSYFYRKKVVNFDMINHECRGEPLEGSYKDYKTVKNSDFENFPKNEKKKVLSGIFRKVNRDNLWIKRDLMIEYFKKNF